MFLSIKTGFINISQHDKNMGETLYKLLNHRGKAYNKRQPVSERVKILGRIGIEQRPAVADLKQEADHFEIDMIFGIEQKSFLLAVVDKVNKTFTYIVASMFHEF